MLNKTVGYSGFRTYGELPYPTRKPGKQLQLANKVWESTIREVDKKSALENYRNSQSIYKKSYLQNTYPQNYHPQHVPKGGSRTLQFPQAGSIKAYDKQQARRYGTRTQSKDDHKNRLLQTGAQHWKTNYQKINQENGFKKTGTGHWKPNYQKTKKQEEKNEVNKNAVTTNNWNLSNSVNNNANNTKSNIGGKTTYQIAEQQARAKSYKNKPYINNAKTGITDYKFNYGQKIGSTPFDLMNRVSYKQPLRDHPLKRGTNQLWSQIPNYQGFKPSDLNFKNIKIKLNKEIIKQRKCQITSIRQFFSKQS